MIVKPGTMLTHLEKGKEKNREMGVCVGICRKKIIWRIPPYRRYQNLPRRIQQEESF